MERGFLRKVDAFLGVALVYKETDAKKEGRREGSVQKRERG